VLGSGVCLHASFASVVMSCVQRPRLSLLRSLDFNTGHDVVRRWHWCMVSGCSHLSPPAFAQATSEAARKAAATSGVCACHTTGSTLSTLCTIQQVMGLVYWECQHTTWTGLVPP
jgi:hypothetical protein